MQNKLIICILYFAASCWSSSASSGTYRWVDDKGNVHFGDKPEQAGQGEDITEKIKDRNIHVPETGKEPFIPYKHNNGRNVTKYFIQEDHSTPFAFTSYSLQRPLLRGARLLQMVHRKDSIWFASDIGLIQFSKPDEQWYLYDRQFKLPGDTAHKLTLDGNRLILKIYDGAIGNRLTNPQHIWFDVENNKFKKSTKTFEQAMAGGSYTVKNSDVLSNTVYNVLHYDKKVWLTTGVMNDDVGKSTGGVSVLKPLSKRGKQYTVRDGLAHPYCYDITASENNSVWVTHWKPELGLSVLEKGSHKWQQLKTSRNGVELGGVRIAAVGHYILIGQQRALVIYDKHSGLAFELDEAYGMPGRIVSDITVDNKYTWVSAYTYSNRGSIRSGLVKIAHSELGGLFERLRDEEQDLVLEKQASSDPLPPDHESTPVRAAEEVMPVAGNMDSDRKNKWASPNIHTKKATSPAELHNLAEDFDDAIFDNWLSYNLDCTYNFSRVDLQYENYIQFASLDSQNVFPIVSRNNKSFELYYSGDSSGNIRYQYDTRKNVLLRHSSKPKPDVQYICADTDVPQIFRDHYSRYLIEQEFLAGHREGGNVEVTDGAKFLEQECRRSFEAKEYNTARSTCGLAAAHSDNVAAQYNMGMLYRFETGGDIDYRISFKHTLDAANGGFSPAYGWLAWHYENAKGVAQNYEEGLRWRIAAVDAGHVESSESIANYYMQGRGVEKDYVQAADWLQIAAEAGDSHAQNKLGCMYANGVGLKRDYKQAHHWIRESYNKNNPKAVFNLAVLYEQGKIGENGKENAKPLYERARKKGIRRTTDIIDKHDRVWVNK